LLFDAKGKTLAGLARTYLGAWEENRAKGAKDAKVKGMKDNEIARVVVGGAFAFDKELDDQGKD
jgi:hypothetical protein